jgi:hypothetical protein
MCMHPRHRRAIFFQLYIPPKFKQRTPEKNWMQTPASRLRADLPWIEATSPKKFITRSGVVGSGLNFSEPFGTENYTPGRVMGFLGHVVSIQSGSVRKHSVEGLHPIFFLYMHTCHESTQVSMARGSSI